MAERPVREALLEAAYDVAVTTGWARARMADVAAAAGVSRQTLYDQFGDREQLAEQLAIREAERFLGGTESAIAGEDDVVRAVEASVRFCLGAARDNPLLHAILTNVDDQGLLPFITSRAEPMLAAARVRVLDAVRSRWPEIATADAELLAETTTRLVLSYIVSPATSIDATARQVATLAARILDRDSRSVS